MMDIIAELLIRDGISTALIVVLVFIWRDISRISRKVDSFNSRLYQKDGTPIYQNVKECGDQMTVCYKDINNIGMKVHAHNNELIHIKMEISMLKDQLKKGEINNGSN